MSLASVTILILTAAIERIAVSVLGAGKILGILVSDEADAVRWIERGARYVCFNIESLLRASSLRIQAAIQAATDDTSVEKG